MRYFMYLVIAASMLAAYLSMPGVALVPGVVKFLPDLLSALTALYVIAAGTRQRFHLVSFKYFLVLGSLALVMVCGPLVNQEPPGPMVNGMRYYLRAIPFFFVPAVVDFSDQDLWRYLKLYLGLSLIQSPLAVYQRFQVAAHNDFSGDAVIGTLMISGILSLFLISVLCVMGSLMLRGRVGKLWYTICFFILVVPMSVNETKVTVILLPLGLLVTFALASPPGKRILVTVAGLSLLILGGAIFVPVYNYYNTLHNPVPFTVQDFFSNPKTLEGYMEKDASVGTDEEAGRGDAIAIPFKAFKRDPVRLTFGLGLGNASRSSLGPQFSGQYEVTFWNFTQVLSVTAFLLELGVLGTALILLLHFMILKDAVFVSRHDKGLIGALAPGYIGGWITITVGLFYLAIHSYECLSFTFFFFSGLMCARAVQLKSEGIGPRQHALVPRHA